MLTRINLPVVMMMLVQLVLKLLDRLQFFGSDIVHVYLLPMNFCNLFALPYIPFRRMHRALLSVLV